MEADSIRDEERTVGLIGTALVMNRPRDAVVRRAPASVVVKGVDEGGARLRRIGPAVTGIGPCCRHSQRNRTGGRCVA